MVAMYEICPSVASVLLAITIYAVNGLPTINVAPQRTSPTYTLMKYSISELALETTLLEIDILGNAGPCLNNSTLTEIKQSLDRMDSQNETQVEIVTSNVLAKLVKIFESLGHNSVYPDNITIRLRTLAGNTQITLNNLILETNMASPNVSIGMICQEPTIDTLKMLQQLVSMTTEIKRLFDYLVTVFSTTQ